MTRKPPTAKGEKPKGARSDRPAKREFIKWNRETQSSLLFWVTVILLTYLLLPSKPFKAEDYKPGDIAQKDIKATQSLLVEDPATTKARKLEAEASVLAVYDFDRDQELETLKVVKDFFSQMRQMLEVQRTEEALILDDIKTGTKPEQELFRKELEFLREAAVTQRREAIDNFISRMSLEVTPEQFKPLLDAGFDQWVETIIADSFQPILGMGIVANRESLLRERGRGVSLRMLHTISEEIILDDFSNVLSLQAARAQVLKGVTTLRWTRKHLPVKRFLENLVQDLVRPNMTYNRSETDDRKKRAVDETSPVYYQVRKGEVIVRAGDPLTDEHILKINELKRLSPDVGRSSLVLGLFLFVAAILFTFFMVLKVVYPPTSRDIRGLVILALIIVLQMAVTRGVLVISQALITTYTGLTEFAIRLIIPFALGSMVAGTLFPVTVALLVASMTSILAAAYLEWSHLIFLYSFIGGTVASYSVMHCRQRSSLIRAGIMVGGANIAVTIIILMYNGDLFKVTTTAHLLFAATSGVLVALIASMVIPLMESAFNVASDMKLMELANLNQPALKEMIFKAPGSYHHSVLVGSLAEAAAEEIDANPLLARVAAAYHDIGKVNKPEYFVENQEDKDSRHEKLSPNMSALILSSHVKDGAEIAREHRLPRRVVDIIKQHHGTRLISFFYNKAKEMEDPSVQTVDERDFRYPGPRPQSREAALIMLADAVEAASKVLSDPTPARIRGLVQKIINDIFIDGQLDESNLTLRDLHQIARSFTRTITGILHHRIDYPEAPGAVEDRKKERKKKNGPSPDPEPGSGAAAEDAEGPGVQNIKRLGQS